MPRATLLSRIRSPELAQPTQLTTDRELRDSILENLAHMCGTRLGTMLTCPDYGIADISEMVHAFPDAIHLMAQTLRHTIQTYEPRLQNVQIVYVPNEGADLTLRFEVRARLVDGDTKRTVRFETLLDASRRFTIR
ncbi:MAG: type VI secretion system baseplate subunit TssE [Polyangiaceae bacterium]|jgi:type VI secretion system protein